MTLLDRVLDALMATLMATAVGVAVAAVFFRYVIERSLVWSFEASLALLCYMTFVGAYVALRRGAHLRVDVLVVRLPLPLRGLVFLMCQAIIAAVCIVMIYWGTQQTLKFADRTTTVMELPLGYLYVVVPLSGLGMLIECVLQTFRGLRRLRAGNPPDDGSDQFSLG